MRCLTHNGIIVALVVAVAGAAAQAVDFSPDCYQNTSHGVFLSGLQRFATLKQSDGLYYKNRTSATAGSVGYRYSTAQWSAGVAVSYEGGRDTLYFDNNNIKMRDHTLGFTLFGTYTAPSGWYASSSIFTGFTSLKTRDGTFGTESLTDDGNDNSTFFAASLEVGKSFDLGDRVRITPHVGMDYAYTPGVEIRYLLMGASGAQPMRHQNVYEIPLGVTLAKDFVTCDWIITPSLDLTMVTTVGRIEDDSYNFRRGFASYDGDQWRVYGVGANHWGGRIAAGVRAVKSERFDMSLKYTYEGRRQYNSHRIMAGFGLAF